MYKYFQGYYCSPLSCSGPSPDMIFRTENECQMRNASACLWIFWCQCERGTDDYKQGPLRMKTFFCANEKEAAEKLCNEALTWTLSNHPEKENDMRSGINHILSYFENSEQNQPPVTMSDNYTVRRGEVLTVSADEGVLANDNDPDGDSLTAKIWVRPTHGTISLNSDGSFTYTLDDDGFIGNDSFQYYAEDNELKSDAVMVTISILEEQEPPPPGDCTEIEEELNALQQEFTTSMNTINDALKVIQEKKDEIQVVVNKHI